MQSLFFYYSGQKPHGKRVACKDAKLDDPNYLLPASLVPLLRTPGVADHQGHLLGDGKKGTITTQVSSQRKQMWARQKISGDRGRELEFEFA
ncbi:hypothetical protein MCOR15_006307 [Pyricularia oryzae]|nr:hypothetical protein MCOR15_006307 [Pyricularia oryzae]